MKTSKTKTHRPTGRPLQRGSNQPLGPAAGRFRQFEIHVEPKPPLRPASISACLIVKNEASNIRPCLSSLEDLASEIIVVDTGSTDDTVEIAEGLGAKVFHFTWIGDFAAARNESIKHATKEWIFWLDADDRLSPAAVTQLKAAAASGAADAYACLISSETADAGTDVTEHIRLFRNGIGVQFASSVHETVYPYIVALGLRLARSDIQVNHTGYESREARRKKSERNLAIIESAVTLQPNDPDLIFYRGQARGVLDDLDGLEADMRRTLQLIKPGEPFNLKRFWAYTSIGGILGTRGRLEELGIILRQALAEFPRHPRFLLMQAQLQMSQGNHAAAAETLQTALKSMRSPIRGVRPRDAVIEKSLAEAYHALGNLSEAVHWAKQARDHEPDSTTIAYFLARLYSEANRLDDVEKVLEPHLSAATSPEPWLLMAEVRAGQKRWTEAMSAVEEAKRLGLAEETYKTLLARLKTGEMQSAGEVEDAGPAARLKAAGIALLRTGEHLKAAESFAAAVQAAPNDAESYKYLAAALKALGQEEQALEAWRLAMSCQVPA